MGEINRRSFINKGKSFSLATLAAGWMQPAWSRNLQQALKQYAAAAPSELADEEEFWHYVQQAYTTTEAVINLNNGGVAPAPKVVQDTVKRYLDFSNEAPGFHMLRILDLGREHLRRNLAGVVGCDATEIALQRNATEALHTIIFGMQLRAGDEVVLSKQDYPSMIHAWQQRSKRDGIKLVWAELKVPSEDAEYLTDAYTHLFTSRTRVVHLTHMLNWNGQILPVKAISDVAHKQNILVVVDGAQSFAQFPYAVSDLGADFFAASLHKWMGACIGTGFLYVRSNHIQHLYPLFAAGNADEGDIRKFEHLGTRPIFIEQATGKAIDFHLMIGAERKRARLHLLKNYWMEKIKPLPGVALGTSLLPEFGCAVGLFSIKGISAVDLDNFLFQKYRIHTTPSDWANISGVRVSPNVYTTTKDLDLLVTAITQAATKGIK